MEDSDGATCSDTIEEDPVDDSGVTSSKRSVDKKFVEACDKLRQGMPFLNLCEEDTALSIAELNYHLVDSRWQRKEMQDETNLSVIQGFIVTVAREYDMSAFGRFDHLCDFIGAQGLQRDGVQILVKFQGGEHLLRGGGEADSEDSESDNPGTEADTVVRTETHSTRSRRLRNSRRSARRTRTR
ncbi:hypothetical protein HOP50_19g84450 [Chloropicon primus]|uniref:Uncharacterized protein n=1 Tax=Chloropicon primus TaxID=1764295 RepID=A0A5B8N0V9_9CHLO|nr:hypothetical protein A3770_19p84140 [Chloropicon primus]UPR05097.1 hypothetical protein HOP50_19g84450 [Chloropicon primus]|mmetsp:Transcript_9151/g.26036  ORF Transcript_9151/g.26036 Transcript_9151/m.26036 type:complete len:184 (+) Transcript_9151:80-631(+)|eukprot:QDZ25896.1 hypothetical protein A3770_19p84140 [Chloropicon primus]